MSVLFDERGERARWLTVGWADEDFLVLKGRNAVAPSGTLWADRPINVLGFVPERRWDPTWLVVKMARGYRVTEFDDVGTHEYVDELQLNEWWAPARPEDKRLPTMAAVEMYIRHKVAARV